MQNKESLLHIGFTLIEILISLLLLSIIAVGSFQIFHFSQNSSNSNLVEFQHLQTQQQLAFLQELNQIYSDISTDSDYELLNCLITHQDNCELIP